MSDKPKRQYNLSPEGLKRLQEAIERNRPWERSTGPRTPGGKRRSAANAVWMGHYIKDVTLVHDPGLAEVLLCRAVFRWFVGERDGLRSAGGTP